MKDLPKLLAVVFPACWVLFAGALDAHAACVSGQAMFHYQIGGHCDTNEGSCYGVHFNQNGQNTSQPIPEANFEVLSSAGALLAEGSTDWYGNFAACYTGSNSTQVVVVVRMKHKSGAFEITQSNGTDPFYYCPVTPSNGAAWCNWGYSGNPPIYPSLYYTGFAFLKNAVHAMGVTSFTNVRARTHQSSSSSIAQEKLINLANSSTVHFGFGTLMHEMGHVVHAKGSKSGYLGPKSNKQAWGGSYTACGGDGAWSWESKDECKDVVYSEGLAEHLAIMARNSTDAATRACTSRSGMGQSCLAGNGVFVEPNNNCSTVTGRDTVLDAMKYLWDTYDPSMYTPISDYDAVINRFPEGRDNHDKSENWCCTFWSCSTCNHDDANIGDFEYHLQGITGTDSSDLLDDQCL